MTIPDNATSTRHLKVVSFNVNSIRVRLHQLVAVIERIQPDIIALQETKVSDEEFPIEQIQHLGYPHVEIYGQKTHYGVALLSRISPQGVQKGIPWRGADQQRRFIAATYATAEGPVRLVNGYFPQGENRNHEIKFSSKTEFYKDILKYIRDNCSPKDCLLVVGDMNIAPQDLDIGIGEENRKRWLRTGKTSFLPEEREWLQQLLDWGLVDCYAESTPDSERLYSWFDYRSRGFERDPKRGLRIDLVLASPPLASRLAGSGIDYTVRAMDKPSDHSPVWADFRGDSLN